MFFLMYGHPLAVYLSKDSAMKQLTKAGFLCPQEVGTLLTDRGAWMFFTNGQTESEEVANTAAIMDRFRNKP